jgi:hypothetical protein
MSKILIYSDIHIGAERVSVDKVISTLNFVNDLAKEKGITKIFNFGDTFDFFNHTKSKMKITPELMTIIQQIGPYMENHVILRGNHEYNEEGDLIVVFNIFGALTVCEPMEIEIDGRSILLLPFYEDKDIDKISFKFKDYYDYVFAHLDISGASFESGFKDVNEDSSLLTKFKFGSMYIGHYHIRQQIRSNIWSVGSCQSRVRTDNPTRMGFTILDLDTGEMEFIENPFAEYNSSESIKYVGTQYEATKKYNLLEEIDNFKLEKTGIDVIIDYTKTKKGVYDDSIIDYTIDYLEGLKRG